MKMPRYHEINHPLLEHKLSFLRDESTNSENFRKVMKDVARLLTYEAFRDWKEFDSLSINTPIKETNVQRISNPPVVVSIMRAGNIFMDAALEMLPFASAGHIGIYRDKFINNTVEYYFKLPENVKNRPVILCDPLIATGDTMVAALDRLKNYEVGQIRVLSLLVYEKALERIFHFYPNIDIYALNKEESLNEKGYLVPGVGDAGDRLFGTL